LDTLHGGLPGEEVEAIAILNGKLIAGGGYNNTNSYIAVYDPTTGVNTLPDETPSFTIYPNPATSGFTVTSGKVMEKVEISDMYGKIIYRSEPQKTSLRVELGTPGVYLVSVTTGRGKQTKKVTVVD
jgi:hypothetical protein